MSHFPISFRPLRIEIFHATSILTLGASGPIGTGSQTEPVINKGAALSAPKAITDVHQKQPIAELRPPLMLDSHQTRPPINNPNETRQVEPAHKDDHGVREPVREIEIE
jgi:hypothetical protein